MMVSNRNLLFQGSTIFGCHISTYLDSSGFCIFSNCLGHIWVMDVSEVKNFNQHLGVGVFKVYIHLVKL